MAAGIAEIETADDWVGLGAGAADLFGEDCATSALHRMLRLPASVARSALLLPEAWRYRNNLIVHDAIYVVLAERLGVGRGVGGGAGQPVLLVGVQHDADRPARLEPELAQRRQRLHHPHRHRFLAVVEMEEAANL